MSEYYVIEDGMVKMYNRTLTHQAKAEDFIKSVQRMTSQDPIFFPAGCVSFARKNEKSLYLMEVEPAKRQVTYQLRTHKERRDLVYEIQLPWLYFLICFRGKGAIQYGKLLVSRDRIQAENSLVGVAPFPNVNRGIATICAGTGSWNARLTPMENCHKYVEFFFTSKFNNDLGFGEIPDSLRRRLVDHDQDDETHAFMQLLADMTEKGEDVSKIPWHVEFEIGHYMKTDLGENR